MEGTHSLSIEELLKVGAHFGHSKSIWNPKMAPFIYGLARNNVHILDLAKTVRLSQEICKFIAGLASSNRNILFVSTKPHTSEIVKKYAEECGQFYVNNRWRPGALTNWKEGIKSMKKLKKYDELLDSEVRSQSYTKKEIAKIRRKYDKLQNSVGGIRDMRSIPDCLFVLDVNKDRIAISEANMLGIPVIGVLDSDSNPDGIDYPLPANDDSTKTIDIVCAFIARCYNANVSERGRRSRSVDDIRSHSNSERGNKRLNRGDTPKAESESKKVVKSETMNKAPKIKEKDADVDLIKRIRSVTGAGILDCRNAVKESNGSEEKAVEILRKKGIASADKKSERDTDEGLVYVHNISNAKLALLQLSCETDFVAKGEKIRNFAESLCDEMISKDVQGVNPNISPFEDSLKSCISSVGENIRIPYFRVFDTSKSGSVIYYIHNKYSGSNVSGKMASIVVFDGKSDEFGEHIAMHIAANAPKYLDRKSVPQRDIDKEREILMAQVAESGKKGDVIDKIVDGRMQKFFASNVLLEQKYLMDDSKTVGKFLESSGVHIVKYCLARIGIDIIEQDAS